MISPREQQDRILFFDIEKGDRGAASSLLSMLQQRWQVDVVSYKQTFFKRLKMSSFPYEVILVRQRREHGDLWKSVLLACKDRVPYIDVVVVISDGGDEAEDVLRIGAYAFFAYGFKEIVLLGYIESAVTRCKQEQFLRKFGTMISSINDNKSDATRDTADFILTYIKDEGILEWKKATLALINHRNLETDGANVEHLTRTLVAYLGYEESSIDFNLLRPIKEDQLMLRVIKGKRPFICANLETNPPAEWDRTGATRDVKSWLGLPLYYGGYLIAIITFDHDQPDYYLDTDELFLTRYAQIAATALEESFRHRNSRLLEAISLKYTA